MGMGEMGQGDCQSCTKGMGKEAVVAESKAVSKYDGPQLHERKCFIRRRFFLTPGYL
jgi:hypothetical protein